jgi:hypothetical protein
MKKKNNSLFLVFNIGYENSQCSQIRKRANMYSFYNDIFHIPLDMIK